MGEAQRNPSKWRVTLRSTHPTNNAFFTRETIANIGEIV
jgi:hypothetical protein